MNCSCGQSREELWEKFISDDIYTWVEAVDKTLDCEECRQWIHQRGLMEQESEPSTSDLIRWGEHKKEEK